MGFGYEKQISFGNDNKKNKSKSRSFTSFRMTTFAVKRILFGNDNKKRARYARLKREVRADERQGLFFGVD
jgi:hypothetical protein